MRQLTAGFPLSVHHCLAKGQLTFSYEDDILYLRLYNLVTKIIFVIFPEVVRGLEGWDENKTLNTINIVVLM